EHVASVQRVLEPTLPLTGVGAALLFTAEAVDCDVRDVNGRDAFGDAVNVPYLHRFVDRVDDVQLLVVGGQRDAVAARGERPRAPPEALRVKDPPRGDASDLKAVEVVGGSRSEEHTSELQSPDHL